MWQIASQMFLCLLLAGLIGAVAGWALAALLGRDRVARLEELTARNVSLERELGLATQRGAEEETARARLSADLDGALVRTQDLEVRRRRAEDRTRVAEAALTAVTARGEAAEEALGTALTRASEAETSLREALLRGSEAEAALREANTMREQAEVRWRAETVRAAHAEEAVRGLEVRAAEELDQLRGDRERLQASLRDTLERLHAQAQFSSSRERLESSLTARPVNGRRRAAACQTLDRSRRWRPATGPWSRGGRGPRPGSEAWRTRSATAMANARRSRPGCARSRRVCPRSRRRTSAPRCGCSS
jgi:hypothetical protein